MLSVGSLEFFQTESNQPRIQGRSLDIPVDDLWALECECNRDGDNETIYHRIPNIDLDVSYCLKFLDQAFYNKQQNIYYNMYSLFCFRIQNKPFIFYGEGENHEVKAMIPFLEGEAKGSLRMGTCFL